MAIARGRSGVEQKGRDRSAQILAGETIRLVNLRNGHAGETGQNQKRIGGPEKGHQEMGQDHDNDPLVLIAAASQRGLSARR